MPHPPPTPLIDDRIPELVSLREAAATLGVVPQKMRYPGGGGVAHRYGLQGVRAGRLLVYRAADVAAVAAGHQPLPWEDPPELLSAGQVAAQLGDAVTPAMVAEHAKAGRLPCRRIGGRDVVMRTEVAESLHAMVESLRSDMNPADTAAGEMPAEHHRALLTAARIIAEPRKKKTSFQ